MAAPPKQSAMPDPEEDSLIGLVKEQLQNSFSAVCKLREYRLSQSHQGKSSAEAIGLLQQELMDLKTTILEKDIQMVVANEKIAALASKADQLATAANSWEEKLTESRNRNQELELFVKNHYEATNRLKREISSQAEAARLIGGYAEPCPSPLLFMDGNVSPKEEEPAKKKQKQFFASPPAPSPLFPSPFDKKEEEKGETETASRDEDSDDEDPTFRNMEQFRPDLGHEKRTPLREVGLVVPEDAFLLPTLRVKQFEFSYSDGMAITTNRKAYFDSDAYEQLNKVSLFLPPPREDANVFSVSVEWKNSTQFGWFLERANQILKKSETRCYFSDFMVSGNVNFPFTTRVFVQAPLSVHQETEVCAFCEKKFKACEPRAYGYKWFKIRYTFRGNCAAHAYHPVCAAALSAMMKPEFIKNQGEKNLPSFICILGCSSENRCPSKRTKKMTQIA